jgi:hypothetical protein
LGQGQLRRKSPVELAGRQVIIVLGCSVVGLILTATEEAAPERSGGLLLFWGIVYPRHSYGLPTPTARPGPTARGSQTRREAAPTPHSDWHRWPSRPRHCAFDLARCVHQIDGIQEPLHRPTRPFYEPTAYVNAVDDAISDDDERVRSAYGSNFERLVLLKNRYDPTNVFRLNANIRPTV